MDMCFFYLPYYVTKLLYQEQCFMIHEHYFQQLVFFFTSLLSIATNQLPVAFFFKFRIKKYQKGIRTFVCNGPGGVCVDKRCKYIERAEGQDDTDFT